MKQRDIHIKNNLYALLSTMAALLITFGCVAQFHHHCHGDIFLSVSLSSDIGLGGHHGIDRCGHNRGEDTENGDDCAMHLDDTSLSREDQNLNSYFCAINISCTVTDYDPPQSHTIICKREVRKIPTAPCKQAKRLRAPPPR